MSDIGRFSLPGRSPRVARVACVSLFVAVSVLLPAPALPQELGRLFFTPQQRQDLDRRRQMNVVEAETVVENLVTVNGHVARSSGKTTTWINGVPQDDTYRGRDPARVAVDAGNARVGVKVGETFDRARGQARDLVGPGEIRVPPERTR